MEELVNDPLAFVRPSASGTTLGGVHSRTRETMLLCEASGYEVIIIETVGVGQSETSVKGMVDFFLLLMLAGAGDELQGIKRGIMEMADAVAINKADGDNIKRSELAKREYQNALHMFPASENGWSPRVLTCSAVNNTGIREIWDLILEYERMMKDQDHFYNNRQKQNLQWMHDTICYHLQHNFYHHAQVSRMLDDLKHSVESETIPANMAAKQLLEVFLNGSANP